LDKERVPVTSQITAKTQLPPLLPIHRSRTLPDSDRVYQDYFEIAGIYAEYRVIRLWEVPVEELMQYPGLLPFAALGKTENPERALRDAVRAMGRLPDRAAAP
jgi:predicted transposase YdaD